MKLRTAILLSITLLCTGLNFQYTQAQPNASSNSKYIEQDFSRKLSKDTFEKVCLVYKQGYGSEIQFLSQGESVSDSEKSQEQIQQDSEPVILFPPLPQENIPPVVEKPKIVEPQSYPQLMTMKQVVGNETRSRVMPNKKLNIYRDHIDMRRFKAQLNIDVVKASPYVQQYYKSNMVSPIDILDNSKTPSGTFLTIDKSRRILTIYKDRAVLYKFPVSLGRPGSQTPTMKTKINLKAINPAWGGMNGKCTPVRGGAPNNPLGKRWLSTDYRGGGIIGIHGTLSHGTIGTYESAGCIRMTNHDVETFVYPSVPVGSPLYIGSTEQLKEWGVIQTLEKVPDPQRDLKKVQEVQAQLAANKKAKEGK